MNSYIHAYELLPRLKYLTLTVDNSEECWVDRLQFIGTNQQWYEVKKEEENI